MLFYYIIRRIVISVNFETIKFELNDNGIGILTLNRPDKLNAMSFQMIKDLLKRHHQIDEVILK